MTGLKGSNKLEANFSLHTVFKINLFTENSVKKTHHLYHYYSFS